MGRLQDGRALVAVSKTTADVLDGTADLSEWDEEELRRGQRRDRNGRFHGCPPKVVPAALHREITRRTLSKANQLFVENTVTAVEVLVDIATDIAAPHSDRLKAATLIVERVMGRSPVAIEVAMHEPLFLQLLRGIVPGDDGDDEDDDVIDAELVE